MRRRLLLAGLAAAVLAPALPVAAAVPLAVTAQPGPGRAYSDSWLGLNGYAAPGPAWGDARLRDALRASVPGTLRWPGGTVANYWDGRRGWFQPGGPWPGQTGPDGQVLPRLDLGLPAFAGAARTVGARPVFVLNLLTTQGRLGTPADDPQQRREQIALLRAAAAEGLPVDRVELGNEFYLPGGERGPHWGDYEIRYPDVAAYAEQVRAWLPPLRRAFPGVRIAAVGADALTRVAPRRGTWNDGVLSGAPGIDALTLHLLPALRDPSDTYESVVERAWTTVQAVRRHEVAEAAALGKRTWISEFNVPDRTPDLRFAGTWAHGLANAVLALSLLEEPRVELALLHNVLGDAVAGAHFTTTQGFHAPEPATTPLAHTATGATLAAVQRTARGATRVRPLSFPGAPVLAGGSPGLVGSAFSGPAGTSAVVVNGSAQAVRLDVTGLYPGGLRWERLTAASLATRVTGPGVVAVRRGEATGSVLLPPRAVVRLHP